MDSWSTPAGSPDEPGGDPFSVSDFERSDIAFFCDLAAAWVVGVADSAPYTLKKLREYRMNDKRLPLVLGAATVLLAGCASTGVVPMDRGVYMISKKSAGGAFVSGDEVKADLYIEANAFCAKTSQTVETIRAEGKNAIPFVRTSQATLEFRCVKT